MNPPSSFSVIICSIDAWKFTQTSVMYKTLLADTPHEIIGIHDAKSLAEGYNRGMAQAQGDILIFSHDDVLFLDPDFARKLSERMANWDILGFAGCDKLIYPMWSAARWPHLYGAICHPVLHAGATSLNLSLYGLGEWPVAGGIKAVDGLCIIARAEVARNIGFDAATFDHFHLYDLDFSFAAHLAGCRIGVCCDIPVCHQSSGNFGDAQRYFQRFMDKFRGNYMTPEDFRHTPLTGVSENFRDYTALLRAWNEPVFRRAAAGIHYRQTGDRAARDKHDPKACMRQ
jgi:glycosyltransferase involved in cell wall biosynthesis